jgi:hypothetical protein
MGLHRCNVQHVEAVQSLITLLVDGFASGLPRISIEVNTFYLAMKPIYSAWNRQHLQFPLLIQILRCKPIFRADF